MGLIEDLSQAIGAVPEMHQFALLIGAEGSHLGQSALLAEVLGREDGPPPPVDLEAERRHGAFILENRELIGAATDLSDGGLALAAFEMAAAAGIGLRLERGDTAFLFGEDQARYLVAASLDQAEALARAGAQAGIAVQVVGRFGGDTVRLGSAEAPMAELLAAWRGGFAKALGVT